MKIVCSACLKKYDHRKHSGVCPYCGMHASDEQLMTAEQDEPVKQGSVKEMLRSYLNVRLRSSKKRSPLRKKSVQLPLCLVLAGLLAWTVISGVQRYNNRLEYYRSRRDSSVIHIEEYSVGDSTVIGDTTITLTGSRLASEFDSMVSEGYKLIEVTYTDKGGAEYRRISDAYVQTEKGGTALALDRFNIMSLTGMTEKEFMESEYDEAIYSTAGRKDGPHKLLFALPEGDRSCKVLIFHSSDRYAFDKSTDVRCEFSLGEGDMS